jgi:cytochrome P450
MDVVAILNDPEYLVPAVDPPGPVGTIAWLRATVSRFCNGEAHARRRALVEAQIGALDVDRLRSRAAREDFLRVLASETGVSDVDAAVEAVAVVARAYHPGTSDPGADEAVATLVRLLPEREAEALAQHIALLVQASTATATLLARAHEGRGREAAPGGAASPADAVAAALREAPPVPTTKRVGPDGLVVLPLDGVPFGAGPRACPGEAVARALVEGSL